MNILDELKLKRLYFDGGMGTLLISKGITTAEKSEEWNLTHPDEIVSIHEQYLAAGSNIITTNTFGINRYKFDEPEKYAKAALECARKAVTNHGGGYIAYDIGSLGRLLKPLGNLDFEEAVSAFGECAGWAEKYGADLIIIETMTDSYETKAALLAAKEATSLPVFVTNAYDRSGKLMTGADPLAMIAMLEGLGADAIGINCSFGPDKMLPIAEEYVKYASVPVIVNPNAGMPEIVDGTTVYDISAKQFAGIMTKIAETGAAILGGCCGTTPEYIRELIKCTSDLPYFPCGEKHRTVISSYTHAVEFGYTPVLIGERINPTGKKKIKEALRDKNYDYILQEGVKQTDAGAHVLDVNAGLPEIDEAEALAHIVGELQAVTDLPLQIDTTDPSALERALRIYNGKPLINSVNGSAESMAAVFPLAKKYGGAIIALTMDENGIPETADGRFEIARRIISEAEKYGIKKEDLIFDTLAMTVSSDQKSAIATLGAIEKIKQLGVCTSLGVSNISFGLPERSGINSVFFTMAMHSGLDAAIMNPFSHEMMNSYYSYCLLSGKDENCINYIAFASNAPESKTVAPSQSMTLSQAIVRGLSSEAKQQATELLKTMPPLDIIDGFIVPALNETGKNFEQKKAYLPQLLMSADAASAAFAVIRAALPTNADKNKRIVLATVKGDIHDIGKNIVKVLLENYGFYVDDLGRDVAPEAIVEAAKGCKLVGLSALMTTTVPSMEETIKQLRAAVPDAKVVVGGAVLTQEYADMIGADFYSEDAMATVRVAQQIFGE